MISLLFFCAAMDILANCRAMLPAEPVTMTGEIVLRNRKGIPSGEYGYMLHADRTATPAKLAFEFREQGTTNVLERMEILRPGPVPEGRVLKTDVTWLDLSLDFLWWPKAEYEAEREGETVHGQKCDVILISNGERQVRAWCDRKTGCLMQAEELKEGKPDAARAFVAAIAAHFGLEPQPLSKFARAKALRDAAPGCAASNP